MTTLKLLANSKRTSGKPNQTFSALSLSVTTQVIAYAHSPTGVAPNASLVKQVRARVTANGLIALNPYVQVLLMEY